MLEACDFMLEGSEAEKEVRAAGPEEEAHFVLLDHEEAVERSE
jgi:hypothetical protein